MSTVRTLIVGLGSPHGDDQAGWLVADQLVAHQHAAHQHAAVLDPGDVAVRKAATPVDLIGWLDGIDHLLVCDACRGLGRVGAVRSWTWPASELEGANWSGTHDFALPAALQLAQRIGQLPPRVEIWSVEGAHGDALAMMSPEVLSALPELIDGMVKVVTQDKRCTNKR